MNFDDPGTYHLYYGDQAGRPGSLLTFFPWRDVSGGRRGTGQATMTSFSVSEVSIGWWQKHLRATGVEATEVRDSGVEEALAFHDSDGLRIALVAHPQGNPRAPWDTPAVHAEHAIRGLHSVTLQVSDEADTVAMLSDLGLRAAGEDGNRLRFAAGKPGPAPW